jgi:predicted permease
MIMESRQSSMKRFMESIVQDLVYAFRLLRRTPGFTVAVVLSLALGIGANTAIFTLMDAVLWRMLPISSPESLFAVAQQNGADLSSGFTYDEYRLLRDNNPAATLAGYTTAPVNVTLDGRPEPSIQGQLVSGDYFSLLGVNPILGRALGPDDDRVVNGHAVAILSHGYWERRFARDQSVIGRTITLSGTPFTIVGVTPREFFGVEIGVAPDIFVPIMMQPTVMPAFENLLENPIVHRGWVQAIARMKGGATLEQASAALTAAFQNRETGAPKGPVAQGAPQPPPARIVLAPATSVSSLRRQFSRPLFVLLAMVGVVLLTACANTANLLLARAAVRRSELAMRLALGAARRRLIRQLLVESIVLAGLGGVCGLLFARWGTQLLVAFMSSGRTPIVLELTPNLRILAFTAAVSAATGILFGLVPAWRATRIDLTPALKNLRGSLMRGLQPGRVLAVAQLALSLLLLVAAGLFVRSLQKLNAEGTGALRNSVLILRVEPKGSDQRGVPGTTERLDRTYRELIRRAQELPGVRMASMANSTPTAPTSTAGAPVTLPSGERVRVPLLMVYPNYFATIGIPFVRGRDFGPGDLGERSPAVCIVNESYARTFFPGDDPIGKPCHTGRRARLLSTPSTPAPPNEQFAIVGVVRDSRYTNPRGLTEPLIYMTFLQTSTGRGQMVLHVRTDGNVGEVLQRIREEVTAVDPAMPMFNVHTLNEEMGAALVQQRLIALLSTLFGALALLLACVGLYGLLAFAMVQRTAEVGIRMALGAQRFDVLWLVVREALLLVVVGIAIGLPVAFVVARLASSQISGLLFGLTSNDPLTVVAAALTLTLVALFAAYFPARRASRVDPMIALRTE